MSTARTSVGCLAEDYPKELADICQAYVDQLKALAPGTQLPERATRARDVALTFLAEINPTSTKESTP